MPDAVHLILCQNYDCKLIRKELSQTVNIVYTFYEDFSHSQYIELIELREIFFEQFLFFIDFVIHMSISFI